MSGGEEAAAMNVSEYLRRIGYEGSPDVSAERLRRLHAAHMTAVPFENLSIHVGEPVVLDDGALFEKIVRGRRGGFCYELNGLFAALLRALGFDVAMLSAGVAREGGGFGPDFDHMALLVTLEERWLADVGFGDSFVEPLRLDYRGEQTRAGGRAYMIEEGGDRLVYLSRDAGGGWEPQYRFGLTPHEYADFAGMCHYHQTSPESHFTRRRVCSRATASGRVTLSGLRLIETREGERLERALGGEEEYAAALREHFGVVLPHA